MALIFRDITALMGRLDGRTPTLQRVLLQMVIRRHIIPDAGMDIHSIGYRHIVRG